MNNTAPHNYPSALLFLIMLYITLMLAANVVVYKLTTMWGIIVSVGSFVIPFVHVLLDIISERYGYPTAKKIILYSLTCQFIFAIVCASLILLPSPAFWHLQASYDQVLGKLLRVFTGSFLGTLVGLSVNAFIIEKYRIAVKGKYFWARSISASAAGQLIFSVITLTYDMYGIQPAKTIISVILASYVIKLIFTVIASLPAATVVVLLKIYEKTPNYQLNLNPLKFPLSINPPSSDPIEAERNA